MVTILSDFENSEYLNIVVAITISLKRSVVPDMRKAHERAYKASLLQLRAIL